MIKYASSPHDTIDTIKIGHYYNVFWFGILVFICSKNVLLILLLGNIFVL